MKDEYDFLQDERGKFYRPDTEFVIPSRTGNHRLPERTRRSHGVEVEQLVNDMLRRDIALVEAVK